MSQAAALPLTAITAWEMLFDRLGIERERAGAKDRSLLIVGAAGGVGSIMVQLAQAADRADRDRHGVAPRDRASGCASLGAHHVIDHSQADRRRVSSERACLRPTTSSA